MKRNWNPKITIAVLCGLLLVGCSNQGAESSASVVEVSSTAAPTESIAPPSGDNVTPKDWFDYYENAFAAQGFYVGNTYDDETSGEDHAQDQFASSTGVVPVGDFGLRKDDANGTLVDALYVYIFKDEADAKTAYESTLSRSDAYFENAPGTQNADFEKGENSFTVIQTDGPNFQGMIVGHVGNLMKVFEAHDRETYNALEHVITFK